MAAKSNSANHAAGGPIEDILPFDYGDLAATLGSLQVLPENADHLLRLETASGHVACRQARFGKNRISAARLRRWLNDSPFAQTMAAAEDPCPNLFTEQLAVMDGGSFVVFPGLEEGIVFMARHLLDVISAAPNDPAISAFCTHARAISIGILAVGDEVAKRAGLTRYREPGSAPTQGVHVPFQASLTQLKSAVIFRNGDVADILAPHKITIEALDPFLLDPGTSSWSGEPWANPLVTQPLLKFDDKLVVSAPGCLLSALVRAILSLAGKRDLLRPFALAFRHAVFCTTSASLGLLGSKPLSRPVSEPNNLPARGGFFSLDRNKIIHLLVVSDDLQGWALDSGPGSWDLQKRRQLFQEVCDNANQIVRRSYPWVKTTLHLIVFQGLGRYFSIGFGPRDETDSRTLLLPAELLEMISLLEHSDPLALWKYARAIESRRMAVLPLSPLGEYELYLLHRHSFYISDEKAPDTLIVSDDLAVRLRARLATRLDRHAAWLPSEGRFVEVTLLNEDSHHPLYFERPSGAPLYGRLSSAPPRFRILVELRDVAIWILGAERDSLEPPSSNLYFLLAHAAAYWLWQLEPSLEPALMKLGASQPVLEIELVVQSSRGWFEERHESGGSDGIDWEVGGLGRTIIRFHPAFATHFLAADNTGDRRLVESLARLMFRWSDNEENMPSAHYDDKRIEQIVDLHAPLGNKRMITALRTEQESSLRGEGLPPYRPVQDADEQGLLDELGSHLESVLTWPPEQQLAGDEAAKMLNLNVVPFFLELLRELSGGLRPEALVELVARHEALLHEQNQHQLTLPTRLEAFSGEAQLEGRIRDELKKQRETAVASRFILEYVAQQPLTGSEQLALETYDRLLGLALMIFDWGTASDYLHYNLVDVRLRRLPSGRLGVSRDVLTAAQEAYGEERWLQEVSAGRTGFARYWHEPELPKGKKPPEVAELDRATEVEFGLSLSDLVTFLRTVAAYGRAVQPGMVKRCTASGLVAEAVGDLGWQEERVWSALEFFTLKPRQDFFSLPPLFRMEDLYPWRFNRRLSYLRRPLLWRDEGRGVLIWGVGSLEQAGEYLVNLCLYGRLKAESREMRELIAKNQQSNSEAFNDQVADLFADAGAVVRKRVRKVDGLRVEPGDVDALVVVPAERKILAVETKDLSVAKTPAEIDHQLRATFDVQERSAVVKHQERIDWLRQHVAEILSWLGVDPPGRRKWVVEGCIVVSAPLLSPYLRHSPLEVVPWVRLKDEVSRLMRRR